MFAGPGTELTTRLGVSTNSKKRFKQGQRAMVAVDQLSGREGQISFHQLIQYLAQLRPYRREQAGRKTQNRQDCD